MKTPKFTDSQIMSIFKQAESGTPVTALCREYGMSMPLSINEIAYQIYGYAYIIYGTAERVGIRSG